MSTDSAASSDAAPLKSSEGGEKSAAPLYGSTADDISSPKEFKPLRRTTSDVWSDIKQLREGTIPQSIAVASIVGIVCGVAAWLYYTILYSTMHYLWHVIPQKYIVGSWPESTYVYWIPIVGFTMAICLGFTVKYMGEPGDLAYTIKCVHKEAYIGMDHVMPMVLASQFSIVGGGSLGPEAPLVAICAALGGYISRTVFHQTHKNVIRKHTLMGMAGALAAFFGCPLGGSLFALEVNSRFGVEYFEHVIESIFCGVITLGVFRGLSGLPIGPIWKLSDVIIKSTTLTDLLIGCVIGLLGALVAAIFTRYHWKFINVFERCGLLENDRAVTRAILGAIGVVGIGMLVPQTMFWGEAEVENLATLAPSSTYPNVWPTSGLIGFEMDTCFKCFLVGVLKMVAVSFTVTGGYRGGFIFPFFAAGSAFGRSLMFIFPSLSAPIACMSFAAGINVAITRTSLATTIILVQLSGEAQALPVVLTASLTSLLITSYMPFIKSQITRDQFEEDFSIHNQEDMTKEKKGIYPSLSGLNLADMDGYNGQDADGLDNVNWRQVKKDHQNMHRPLLPSFSGLDVSHSNHGSKYTGNANGEKNTNGCENLQII